ncbi:MAG: ABC transporter ATP-binding protein [Thermoguttaceae bacterium]|jgi:ABC-type Fe3+/spermidine/putrescine transport system ATPase subunit|nr:ABC transporter ATP-binding protein [Thermoguttaceae bacterium]
MIRCERLTYSVGSFRLKDVTLEVADGEYFVLLGPPGSGKSMLLECLCGLNRVDSGRLLLDGQDVTDWEPRRRGIGYVPQDYALFPHLSVRRNIASGLVARGEPQEEVVRRVAEMTDMLGIAHLLDRRIAGLSGGERQRVALGRALAVRPRVLLLDEPVSALDEQTRDRLCRLLKRLHREMRTTTVHVCHNFAEMLAVADSAGVIDGGRILQTGSPADVFNRPVNVRVAEFVQAGNLFPAEAELVDGQVRLTLPGGVVLHAQVPEARIEQRRVMAMIRPEYIRLCPIAGCARNPRGNVNTPASCAHVATKDTETPGGNGGPHRGSPTGSTLLHGRIAEVLDQGAIVRLVVAVGEGQEWSVGLGKSECLSIDLALGREVGLQIDPQHVHVLQE